MDSIRRGKAFHLINIGIDMKEQYSETLGQYLRRERESRAVSLEELSKGTRINRPFLEALEKDDFAFFPQRVFIPGFLRGYARYVGLNSKEVLNRYQIQSELESRKESFRQLSLFPSISSPEGEMQTQEKESPPISSPKTEKPYHRSTLIKLAIVLIALGLTLYIHHLLKEIEDRPNKADPAPTLESGGGEKDREITKRSR